MTRRRFFPSSPAQSIPGRTVELEMQLQKAAVQPVAAEAPVAAGACTGWIVPWLAVAPADYLDVVAQPDGRTDVFGNGIGAMDVDYRPLISSVWRGVPAALDLLGRAVPAPALGFFCQEIDISTFYEYQFPGRYFMAMAPGGSWQASWDRPYDVGSPASSMGHRFEISGEALVVILSSTAGGDGSDVDVLTATALMPDGQETQLILMARARTF